MLAAYFTFPTSDGSAFAPAFSRGLSWAEGIPLVRCHAVSPPPSLTLLYLTLRLHSSPLPLPLVSPTSTPRVASTAPLCLCLPLRTLTTTSSSFETLPSPLTTSFRIGSSSVPRLRELQPVHTVVILPLLRLSPTTLRRTTPLPTQARTTRNQRRRTTTARRTTTTLVLPTQLLRATTSSTTVALNDCRSSASINFQQQANLGNNTHHSTHIRRSTSSRRSTSFLHSSSINSLLANN